MALGDAFANDWKAWYQRENITLRVLTNPAVVATDPYTDHVLTADGGAAKRRAITRREIWAGQGKYTSAHIVWLIPKANLPAGVEPKGHHKIVDGAGQTYSVLEVQVNKYGQTFRCIAILE